VCGAVVDTPVPAGAHLVPFPIVSRSIMSKGCLASRSFRTTYDSGTPLTPIFLLNTFTSCCSHATHSEGLNLPALSPWACHPSGCLPHPPCPLTHKSLPVWNRPRPVLDRVKYIPSPSIRVPPFSTWRGCQVWLSALPAPERSPFASKLLPSHFSRIVRSHGGSNALPDDTVSFSW
jgi:hypothetical protein